MEEMIIDHLSRDEFSVECMVRGISSQSSSANNELFKLLHNEAKGISEPPTKPHKFRSLNSEITECEAIYSEVEKLAEDGCREVDQIAISVAMSRFVHLKNRLGRLSKYALSFPIIARLLKDTVARLSEMNTLLINTSSGSVEAQANPGELVETPLEEEAAGAGTLPNMGRGKSFSGSNVDLSRKSVAWSNVSNAGPIANSNVSNPAYRPTMFDPAVVTARQSVARDVESRGLSYTNRSQGNGRANNSEGQIEWSSIFGKDAVGADAAALFRHSIGSYVPGPTSNVNNGRWREPFPSGDDIFGLPLPSVCTTSASGPLLGSNPHSRPTNFDNVPPAASGVGRPASDGHGSSFKGDPSALMSRWKITFDGGRNGLTVEDFVFRIENMARGGRLPLTELYDNLHLLLAYKSATWYWTFRRANPDAGSSLLRSRLLHYFRGQDTDYDVRKELDSRRQGPRETFSDYCLQMVSIAARMVSPMPERELVETIRRNMASYLQRMLFRQYTGSVDDLTDLCREAELLMSRQRLSVQNNDQRRAVNEVFNDEVWDPSMYPEVGPGQQQQPYIDPRASEGDVEAVQFVNRSGRVVPMDPSLWVCWNCKDIGHGQMDCGIPNRGNYCLGCGSEGVLKPACQKCKKRSENRMVSGAKSAIPHSYSPTQKNNAHPYH